MHGCQTSGKTAALPPHCPLAAPVKTQISNLVKHLGRQLLYHHTALGQQLSKHRNQTWSKIWEDSRSTTKLPSGSTCKKRTQESITFAQLPKVSQNFCSLDAASVHDCLPTKCDKNAGMLTWCELLSPTLACFSQASQGMLTWCELSPTFACSSQASQGTLTWCELSQKLAWSKLAMRLDRGLLWSDSTFRFVRRSHTHAVGLQMAL